MVLASGGAGVIGQELTLSGIYFSISTFLLGAPYNLRLNLAGYCCCFNNMRTMFDDSSQRDWTYFVTLCRLG
jgi:hypothetical protein